MNNPTNSDDHMEMGTDTDKVTDTDIENVDVRPLSALPSVLARIVAYIAILVAGLAGGLIGFSLIDLQCHGSCDLQNSAGLIFGSVVSASGMGIVAVLVLRAVGEWRELEDRK